MIVTTATDWTGKPEEVTVSTGESVDWNAGATISAAPVHRRIRKPHFENEEDTVQRNLGQAFVSRPPAQVAEKSVQRVAASFDTTTKESMMVTPSQQQPQPPGATQDAPAFPQPEFSAAGSPGTAPLAHPGKITRSVLLAARKIAPDAAPIASETPNTAAIAPPAPTQPQGTLSLPKKEAYGASSATLPPERKQPARGTVTKEASMARANALEQLLDGARRGVKVTLWRDLLNSSLPFWGNIRRGAVLFRDDLASAAEQAMGLPQGWLDNPSFPPPSLAAWLNDPNAPLPVVSGIAPAATAPAQPAAEAKTKRPYVKKAAPAPTVVMAQEQSPVPAAMPNEPPALVASAPRIEAPAPLVAPAPSPQVVSDPVATQGAPGPLCQALTSILSTMAVEGKFTEQDALSMITNLMAKR